MKNITAAVVLCAAFTGFAGTVDQAMVKIYTNSAAYNYYIPWSTDAPAETSGSGCVVEGNLILTNAHVVSNETFIQVRRKVTRRSIRRSWWRFPTMPTLPLSAWRPRPFSAVSPPPPGESSNGPGGGYRLRLPHGRRRLSTTKGVISRVESSRYAHSGLSLLTVQIDAAINPGNSGGPAIINDRIVGVTMQIMNNSEGIGYVIPVPVIEHFLEDMEDGVYNGFPSAGFSYQTIRNEAFTGRSAFQASRLV